MWNANLLIGISNRVKSELVGVGTIHESSGESGYIQATAKDAESAVIAPAITLTETIHDNGNDNDNEIAGAGSSSYELQARLSVVRLTAPT